ncbi:MAG: Ribonuclease G [uncultured Solirubrobacteraceae bacterium]|uniref:Ribonuclease G n=1 Tax=uncultured Solirubrobacteraceae bacterium TaxID=1162706 RepID=A0A6J4S822_9ACTN|nr:MAG: Ribonuclease G [uncultured Solirubrobacteraceae bacterium]
MLVTVDRGETRVAMLEAAGEPAATTKTRSGRSPKKPDKDFRVAEIYFERRGGRSIVGNIYKGKVDNVLPGLEAAFVDIGLDKNGFLHVDEIVLPGVEPIKRGRGGGGGGKQRTISDLLKPGQEIVCQVVKDPLKTKGARLSMELTIAGRYMVYAPTGEGVGVSRRLEDKERERLRKEVKGLDLHGGGAIVRTAAHGAKREDFERELLYLNKLNEVLESRVAEASAPALVFQEADLSIRVVRDIFSAHFERAVVDDPKQHQRLVSFFTRTAPELVDRVELWDREDKPLFEAFGVEGAIEGMLSRRVDLPSGGYLIIDYAEALTVIDVNSGSFIGRGKQARLEDTITRTNLEAAEEVVNQLRLRDIGGIIVIDFIDMARARNRDAVLKVLRKALDEDRTKTFVVEISPLGLVEMTRQNVTDGVREIMTRPCPTCDGEGVIKSEETIAIAVERRLREIVKDSNGKGPEAYLIRLNPRVTAQFIGEGAGMLHALEAETACYFHFEGSEGLPLDHFAITMEGTRDEVAERAVPFREGEEVHVDIVEPHMYEVDDAVAKVDGYIISVAGAGRFVGQKRLVRIEEAGRTSATALLIDLTEEEREEADDARKAASRSSSRGRRGGRGRGTGSGTTTTARRTSRAGRAGEAAEAEVSASGDDERPETADEPLPEEIREGVAATESDEPLGAPDDSSLPDPETDPEAGAEEDVLDSKPRRRGRRGGRRRSRAKGEESDGAEVPSSPTDASD